MKHSQLVREFVTALSLKELRRKQRALNARDTTFYRFENEQQFTTPGGEIRWVSFYYVDLEEELRKGRGEEGEGEE